MCILCKVKLLTGKKALMHLSRPPTSVTSAAEKQQNTRQSGFFSFITEKALQKLKSKATPHTVLFRSPCTVSHLCKHTAPMQIKKTIKKKLKYQANSLQFAVCRGQRCRAAAFIIESPAGSLCHGFVHVFICACVVFGVNCHLPSCDEESTG